jgi:hypothetical protein
MDTIIAVIIGLDLAIIAGLILVRWAYISSAKEIRVIIDEYRITSNRSLSALGNDFTNYQLRTDRENAELKKLLEIKTKQLERNQVKLQQIPPTFKPENTQGIDELKKSIEHYITTVNTKIKHLEENQTKAQQNLPNDIRRTIGHIEFARPLDK